MLRSPESRFALEKLLAHQSGAARVKIHSLTQLTAGAVQENWKIEAEFLGGPHAGQCALVLRTDAPTRLSASLSRFDEYSVLRAAFRAGVRVPEPLFFCDEPNPLGRPFFLMRWMSGVTSGAKLVHGEAGASRRGTVATELARELAAIHAVKPSCSDLPALRAPPSDPAALRLALYRRWLDDFDDSRPAAEWGLRWLELEKPGATEIVLSHGDFRTGNYLVGDEGLTAILDWEFASWSDPHEDIGWFCCKSWRFGAFDREAGGLVPRATFYRAYEEHSGRSLDPRRLHYWEVMASLRWLILALQQRDRFLRGGERSLALALTGRRPAECEFELLRLIEAGRL
jgi:aminoglycoside phosphotransferase (APT) family kinase protein